MNYDDELFDRDEAFFDFIWQPNAIEGTDKILAQQNDRLRVDRDIARKTADAAEKYVVALRADMIERGLLQSQEQNFAGESDRARIVAPIHFDEIRLGALLGLGGFSAVLEVVGLGLDASKSAAVSDKCEEMSRQFLARNVMRHPSRSTPDEAGVCRRGIRRKSSQPTTPEPRYALKHLRLNLAKEPEKFQRSCIDMVLEGQLLLAMDHPNIIGIRGWPMYGTDAIRSGKLMDYFLILDRLTGTLEERIWEWRKLHRRYKSRCNFPWFQSQKYSVKIESLFQKRLQAAHDVANAIQYMHSKRIIHRDIKSANVGFDVRGDLKLFDFGLSRLLPNVPADEDEEGYCMSRVGTKFYIAPEVQEKKPYSLPADVFSFGVLFWELASLGSARDLYHSTQKQRENDPNHLVETAEKLRPRPNIYANGVVPSSKGPLLGAGWLPICPCWPQSVQDMILQCLSCKPDDRPFMTVVKESFGATGLESWNDDPSASDERRRRRSTFRIDLSGFQAPGGISSMVNSNTLMETSCESKTSYSMSSDFFLSSDSLKVDVANYESESE